MNPWTNVLCITGRGVAGKKIQAAFLSSSALEVIYKIMVKHRDQLETASANDNMAEQSITSVSVPCELADLTLLPVV